MCGEKLSVCTALKYPVGSPPRMRGKDAVQPGILLHVRITPAYAGKRCSARTPTFRTWDHPRVCGEKPVFPSGAASTVGSPLRVRGKDQACSRWRYPDGITPACAGKRGRPHYHMILFGDHPRVCGEKKISFPITTCPMGSPPRVRGKVPSSI